MATAHMKVYENNIENLVKALPMDDVKFTTQLKSNKILPDSVDAHIKSLPTQSNKADYYLKNVIKSSLDIDQKTEFKNLLTVMEKSGHSHIERLASKMKSDLDKEVKGNNLNIMYVHIQLWTYAHNYIRYRSNAMSHMLEIFFE